MLTVVSGVTGNTGVLEDCAASVVIEDPGVSVLIVLSEVTGVLKDFLVSVVSGDSGLPGIFVLTVSMTVYSKVAGNSVLTEISVVGGDSGLL